MNEISLSADGSTITVFTPMNWRRRGGRKVIVAPPGRDDWAPPHKIDNALLKALPRAPLAADAGERRVCNPVRDG